MQVTLSPVEFDVAVNAARLRMIASAAKKLNHSSTYERNYIKRLEEEVIGACAELALGKLTGEYFIPSLNTFHCVPDFLRDVEVRGTALDTGRLILRNNDDDARRYVLAIVDAPIVTFVGWIKGKDGRKGEYVRNPKGYRKAHFVPQEALRPMSEFK
jgi:hypothetical protein